MKRRWSDRGSSIVSKSSEYARIEHSESRACADVHWSSSVDGRCLLIHRYKQLMDLSVSEVIEVRMACAVGCDQGNWESKVRIFKIFLFV